VTLDVANFTFLTLGILLHWTPASCIKAATEKGTYARGQSAALRPARP
jgi:short subunit fatty acids transporter